MSEEGGSGPFAKDAPASSVGSHATITSSVADKANMITLSHPHPTTTRKGVVVDGGGRGRDFEKTATSDADVATENAATYLTGRREDTVCGCELEADAYKKKELSTRNGIQDTAHVHKHKTQKCSTQAELGQAQFIAAVHAQICYLGGQGAQGAGHFRRRLCVRWLSQLRRV